MLQTEIEIKSKIYSNFSTATTVVPALIKTLVSIAFNFQDSLLSKKKKFKLFAYFNPDINQNLQIIQLQCHQNKN